MEPVTFSYIKTNGITLHTAVAGPEEGPLVILLHGFPEFWFGWRNQINVLAKAGYRVVVPDQRGYNVSDKPVGLHHYMIDVLSEDVIGIIKHFKREKASIIGHDWGGAVGWHLAATNGQYVESLIPINMPHPTAAEKILEKCPSQLIRSLYILFFQIPYFSEEALMAYDYNLLEKSFFSSIRPDLFTGTVLDRYKKSWAQPGTMTAMLSWYRAIRIGSLKQVPRTKLSVPITMIWGRHDRFISVTLAKESVDLCENGKFILIDEATHWVHHEQSALVNQHILHHLKEIKPKRG
ncbi:epoxide hydrolase [Halalkalibacter wakoensis JCM 9140]|uniref:Epoxide hydrolase n=1 Tax=Halalkalibacter wakoensis JCM 9140 TaxID=1236970 RepID=W4Q3M7_9BACI|nr:alpha/beta hydrolase [Halalkalibacter wakoensis]GAE26550.1 epoxide hydrolase [Halalkalibacter wakoensis JCM 9140]